MRERERIFERIRRRQPLTDEERDALEALGRVIAERIAPRAAGYDASAEFPWDNVRDLNELQLNLTFLPAAYGGADLSYSCYLTMVQDLSAACASTGVTWATTFHAVSPIVDFGTDRQRTGCSDR